MPDHLQLARDHDVPVFGDPGSEGADPVHPVPIHAQRSSVDDLDGLDAVPEQPAEARERVHQRRVVEITVRLAGERVFEVVLQQVEARLSGIEPREQVAEGAHA